MDRERAAAARRAAWAAGVYDGVDFGYGRVPSAQKTAKRSYTSHKSRATYGGIQFLLTFEEWWQIWNESGKWSLRGRRKGEYCMSRYGDRGAYEIGNVYINMSQVNVGDGSRGIKRTTEQNAARSAWMRGNNHTEGHRWLNNGLQETLADKREADRLLACDGAGWRFGRLRAKEAQ